MSYRLMHRCHKQAQHWWWRCWFSYSWPLMVGLQRDFTLILQRGTHQVFSEQTWAYLIGAEGLARLVLRL